MSPKVDQVDQLHRQICKLRCIAHFIESQEPNYTHPDNYEDIQYGFTQILNGILDELSSLKKNLEG